MRLLNEKILNKLPARLFVEALLLELNKDEPILTGDEYLLQRCDYYDPQNRNLFLNDKKCDISDIKLDIHQFTKEFAKSLRRLGNVKDVSPDISDYRLGLSEYLTIMLMKPLHKYDNNIKQQFANDYVLKHEDDYKLKARLSDHDESGPHGQTKGKTRAGTEYKKPPIDIQYEGRNFIDVAKQLESEINSYISSLKAKEDSYVSRKWMEYKRKLKTSQPTIESESIYRDIPLTILKIREY